jgi:RNA-directed DNA polymerase
VRTFRRPFEHVASAEAMLGAWREYRSGKGMRPEVAAFDLDAVRHIVGLARELLEGRYRHRPYRVLHISDPKPRLIAVASVRDRVVHTAIHQALSPFFNRSFIADSYACLPERGSHRAVLRYRELLRRHEHLVHLDVRRYFPSVDHGVLRGLVHARIRDPRLRALLDELLRSGAALYHTPVVAAFYGLDATASPRGLPIGNLTSQWWGNVYLDGLDQFVKRELKVAGYLRYMDDFALFGDSPGELRRWRTEVTAWLLEHRHLELSPKRGHIRPCKLPQTWLGHRVTRAGHDLGARAVRRFRRSLSAAAERDPASLERSLAAWRGAFTG